MHRRYHCGASNTHTHTLSVQEEVVCGQVHTLEWAGHDPPAGNRLSPERNHCRAELLTILLLAPLWRCCQLPWPRVCCSLDSRAMLTMRGQGPLLWALVMFLSGAIRVGGTGMESGVGGSGREYLQQTEEHWDGKTPWFTGSSCECNG